MRGFLISVYLMALLSIGASWILVPAGGISSPTEISSLKLWLDGADSSAASMTLVSSTHVSEWIDKSGTGNTLTQSTDAKRPLLSAASLNGNSTVAFNRANNTRVLKATNTIVNKANPHTVLAVWKVDSYGPSARAAGITIGSSVDSYFLLHQSGNIFAGSSGNDWNYGVKSNTETSDFNWHYRTWIYDGTGSTTLGHYTMYLDGTAQTVASGNVSGWNGGHYTCMGGYGDYDDTDNNLTGNIAEITVYTKAVAGTELTNLHNYIHTKWGL